MTTELCLVEALNSLVQLFPNHRSPLGNFSNQTRSRGQEAFLHLANFISPSSFHLLLITSSCQTWHNSSPPLSHAYMFQLHIDHYVLSSQLFLPLSQAARIQYFSFFLLSSSEVLPTASLQNRSILSWTEYSANNYIWQSLNVRMHKPMTKSPWTTEWEGKAIQLSNRDRKPWMTLQDQLHRNPQVLMSSNTSLVCTVALVVKYVSAVGFVQKTFITTLPPRH